MDEESLFRDIHNHLIHQAQEGGKMDTEMKLAEQVGGPSGLRKTSE